MKTDRFYVIKDAAGNVYKLRFISFHASDGGVRGYPKIEYKLGKESIIKWQQKNYTFPSSFLLLLISSLSAQQRIVSLSGAISEMLCALSLEPQIVGVDVTSNYPTTLQQKATVGHNRTISAEGILALRPDLVLGIQGEIKPK